MNMFGGLRKHFKGFDSWINRLRFVKLSINIYIYIYIQTHTLMSMKDGSKEEMDGKYVQHF